MLMPECGSLSSAFPTSPQVPAEFLSNISISCYFDTTPPSPPDSCFLAYDILEATDLTYGDLPTDPVHTAMDASQCCELCFDRDDCFSW